MAISFDNALGIHEQALLLRNRRTEVLANNIVNADTPGFKARDIDFHAVLAAQINAKTLATLRNADGQNGGLANMGSALGGQSDASTVTLSYRVPTQPSLDGNTVDEQLENAAFARNALDHQASFQFLNGKFTSLIKAIRGD